jgi:hypothetical protein
MLGDALPGYLESMRAHGQPLPQVGDTVCTGSVSASSPPG